jgi:hypothetical protein
MSPDAQVKTIARLLPEIVSENEEGEFVWRCNPATGETGFRYFTPLTDLNAMHQAVRRTLDDEQMLVFMRQLTGHDVVRWWTVRRAIEATPGLWAEAFLRTLNLWIE